MATHIDCTAMCGSEVGVTRALDAERSAEVKADTVWRECLGHSTVNSAGTNPRCPLLRVRPEVERGEREPRVVAMGQAGKHKVFAADQLGAVRVLAVERVGDHGHRPRRGLRLVQTALCTSSTRSSATLWSTTRCTNSVANAASAASTGRVGASP